MMLEDFELVERDPSEFDETDLEIHSTNAVVSSTDWTTETILSQLRRGNINLSPNFQRRDAWNDERKSRFIESLFLGLPVPQLVLAERREQRGSYIVIDGKQRLLSIRRFGVEESDTKIDKLTISGLKYKPEFNGLTWQEIKDNANFLDDITAYENQTIRTVVVRNWPNEPFLYLIFLRLNTGSLPLSTQELRQALHPGNFITFAEEYSGESAQIRKALNLSDRDFRMRDVELLIRFFAFAELLPSYRGDLKDFLDRTCEQLNNSWINREAEIRELAVQCDEAISATFSIFGDNAFKRWRNQDGYVGRFNRAVFDVMTYYFKQAEVRELAVAKAKEISDTFEQISTFDHVFNESLQTTTKSVRATYYRLCEWGELLQSIVEVPVGVPDSPTKI